MRTACSGETRLVGRDSHGSRAEAGWLLSGDSDGGGMRPVGVSGFREGQAAARSVANVAPTWNVEAAIGNLAGAFRLPRAGQDALKVALDP